MDRRTFRSMLGSVVANSAMIGLISAELMRTHNAPEGTAPDVWIVLVLVLVGLFLTMRQLWALNFDEGGTSVRNALER